MVILAKIRSAFPLLHFSGFELGWFDARCCRPKKGLVWFVLPCGISRVFYVFSIYYRSIKPCQRSLLLIKHPSNYLLSPCELTRPGVQTLSQDMVVAVKLVFPRGAVNVLLLFPI